MYCIEREIVNEYFQNRFPLELFHSTGITINDYRDLPLFDTQIHLKFIKNNQIYVETYYLKIVNCIFFSKTINQFENFAIVRMRMQRDNNYFRIFLKFTFNEHLVSVY